MSAPVETPPSRAVLRAVEETLRTFARAFRAYQMYLPNNPMRAKSFDDARAAFKELWPHTSSVSLTVTEQALLLDGHKVFQDDERGSAGLTWLLYRDGLRRLDLHAGVEEVELAMFLDILHKVKTAPPDEDDLVTLLWVADLKKLQYRNVDLLGDFDALNAEVEHDAADDTQDEGEYELPAIQRFEATLPGDGPPPGAMQYVDESNATLYFLEQREVDYLHEELRREYQTDGKQSVLAALFDIIEAQRDIDAQLDAADVVDRIVVESLAAGEYTAVAYALREARATLERRTDIDAAVHAALTSLPVRLSDKQVIAQLLQVIDSGEGVPLAPLLDDFFAELRPWAMIPLLSWYGGAPASPARNAIERAVARLATRHVSELARLIEHEDARVVRGAVRLSRHVNSPALVPTLAKRLNSSDAGMRLDVVTALAAIASPKAMQMLDQAIEDAQRDVRVVALKAVAERKYAASEARLHQMLQKRTPRNADLSEKMAFFEAFAALTGDRGIGTLDGILNGRGLFGRKETPEMRACAAHALGTINSPAAVAALEKAASATDAVVRSAVSRAMRGGAE